MELFYTQSEEVQQIIKGLNLTRTLFVSSVVIGEPHIGKKMLVRYIFPNTPIVSGADQEAVETLLQESDELIITDIEKLHNHEVLNFDNKRIIATANYVANQQTIDSLFAFIYHLPSLKERLEDVAYIKQKFIDQACYDLMIENSNIPLHTIPINLSQNSRTLKKSVYQYLMSRNMNKRQIQQAVYHYILENLDGNNGYREYIDLYEVPLIKAGLKKFYSQLKLSQILGINRNTLRKKIHEHHID
ncbi:MAG: Fis family transcriptional regulator [Sulfurovum sp.]|nr:Fis family transcriptional regulator [Sulfurovum sp.]